MSGEHGHLAPHRFPLHKDPVLPFIMVAAGLVLVGLLGQVEDRIVASTPWAQAALFIQSEKEEPVADSGQTGRIPVRIRELPGTNFPQVEELVERLRKEFDASHVVDRLTLESHERVVLADLPRSQLEAVLTSGRPPKPGAPEVLAGDLARLDHFELDGVAFHSVGRLKRNVGGVSFAYLLPWDGTWERLFLPEAGGVTGWLDPEGMTWLSEHPSLAESINVGGHVAGTMTRTRSAIAWGTMFGLLLVASGGAMAQVRLLRWLGRRRFGQFTAALTEMERRPRLLYGVHFTLYGLFFAGMVLATRAPVLNAQLVNLITHEFERGDLSYIGAAYATESIPRAALATFFHNYAVATLAFSLAPSLVIPFAGLFKNAVSFSVVGFAMAPIWSGSNPLLLYHAVTLTLELEAYVVASFAACVLPVRILGGIFAGRLLREWGTGFRVLIQAALLVAVMLAIAASYEAATLVLLR
ncbi:MAG TPA: hypothetical protein PLO37_04520 [Candidatus Hydrogenedentes bacterium]|nr:hypothetical protein [Candidatus Hydrogenedentota bacterium]HPG66089.1 hypothetical protein [Candidatus Hydrogenedentota bacterium]